MGIFVVAIHSDADARALHIACADETVRLPGVTSAETYLRGDLIIEAAKVHHVDAILPGYGFLSENADFAQSCTDAGITFIGPSPAAIRSMGDKLIAKELMKKAGVPVVPGTTFPADAAIEGMTKQADAIGYPVLVKAAGGGGGKGMRIVNDAAQLEDSIAAAHREATAAFGDGRVFLEKFLPRARHVEFQIFGDTHGNFIHLFERECSIQRRHQKIIEEAPSPALVMTPGLRARMGDAAVAAARASNYTNAGTVEFLLTENGEFYFLEVNSRLQVEHPVTEMTLGHDLVRAQVLVAAGEKLPFEQAAISPRGHAIECRVYAEDPAHNYMPSTGRIDLYEPPTGPNIRVDSGVRSGSEVSVYYDPMLAKVVAGGETRAHAIARMREALRQFVILGVRTNIEFLLCVIDERDFERGALHTGFLDEHDCASSSRPDDDVLRLAAILADGTAKPMHGDHGRAHASPWHSAGAWRVGP